MYLAVRRERLAATGMSTLDFNVIDVETANADCSSICQIGTITVVNGVIKDRWATLVNPRDWFDSLNTSIHGISRNDVADSPTFPEAHQELRHRLGNNSVLVSHMPFDRVAISRAEKKYGLEPLAVRWLNSAMIARHAWRDNFGKKGYGLKNIAQTLGIEFRHHDALEDARAAAEIVLRACNVAGLDIDGWIKRVKEPVFEPRKQKYKPGQPREQIRVTGTSEGPLTGETIVFTGTLSRPRHEAVSLAAAAGCNVRSNNVTQKTTLLVVGIQNASHLRGYDKSKKHRDAEERIRNGASIKILSEQDFCEIVDIPLG